MKFKSQVLDSMMIKKQFILFIFLFAALSGFTQRMVQGVVKDSLTGKTLSGVNVFIPELQKGTFTDEKGNYLLESLPRGKFQVQFSFIGYETAIRKISIIDNPITMKIRLGPAVIHAQEIVISAGHFSAQHDNAVKIETINQGELEESGDVGLMKKLSAIPGVDVISKGTGITSPVIRGLSTSNILVLNSGVRMENYQFSENHPYQLDEFGLERVEVIKGAASLLYGSDATGGVMNFIREKPAPVGKIIGDFQAAYNTNTDGINTSLGVKGTNESFFWGIRASQKNHADYIDGNNRFVPNSRFNQQSIKTFTGINTSLGVFNLYYEFNKMRPGLTVGPSIALVTARGRKNEVWYQDLVNHLLSSKNTFFLRHWKLEANLSYQYNIRKLMTSPDDENFTNVDMNLQTLNWEFRAKYQLSEDHDIILGWNGMAQQNRNKEAPSHVLPDYKINDQSLLALYSGNISQRLFVQAGLRFEYRQIKVPEQESGGGHSHDEEPGHDEEEILPILNRNYGNMSASFGGTYNLSEALLFRVNLASAYRTPSIAELTQDGQHGARYEVGNRNLESQRNYEADMSVHYHSGMLMFDLAAFYNHINNYIFLSSTPDSTDDGAPIYRYQQSNANLMGFEGSAEVQPREWLQFSAGYAYLRAKQEDGQNLPMIPQNKLLASAMFSKEGKQWYRKVFVRLGAEYAFKQNHPSQFETTTPSYWLLNAGLGTNLMFGKQVIELMLNLNNILDIAYLDHLSTLEGTGFYNIGRNLKVAIKIPIGSGY